MIRLALAALAALVLSGCATLKPDMTDFRGVTLPVGAVAPRYVPINVAAMADLAEVQHWCTQADQSGTAARAGGKYLACAVPTKDGRCLVIVWQHTAYEVLGHEAMHCLFTARGLAGNLQGIPPHFVPPSMQTASAQ
jgi:hypothetical protein